MSFDIFVRKIVYHLEYFAFHNGSFVTDLCFPVANTRNWLWRLTQFVLHSWFIPWGLRSFCTANSTKTHTKPAKSSLLTADCEFYSFWPHSSLWQSKRCDFNWLSQTLGSSARIMCASCSNHFCAFFEPTCLHWTTRSIHTPRSYYTEE